MNNDDKIDKAARAFNAAAAELAQAMLEKLEQEDPALTAKVAHVLQNGERMVLSWEMSQSAPAIWWATINDYQQLRRIMTVPGSGAARQH